MSSKWHLPDAEECCYTPELHVVFWWFQHGTVLGGISKVRHICRPAQVEEMLFWGSLFFSRQCWKERKRCIWEDIKEPEVLHEDLFPYSEAEQCGTPSKEGFIPALVYPGSKGRLGRLGCWLFAGQEKEKEEGAVTFFSTLW